MLVQCPKCRTLYKVADDLLKGPSPSFRCSRCKHTFEPQAQSGSEAAEKNASLFDAPDNPPEQDTELRLPLEERHDDAASDVGATPVAATADKHSGDHWSMSDPEPVDDKRFVVPEKEPVTESGKTDDSKPDFPAYDTLFPPLRSEADDADNILAIASYREQKASILPFVTLFGLLVIGFTLIAVVSHARPQAAENLIRHIPLLGPSLLKNQYLKNGILLRSLRSGYQTIQGNREVFLISGTAINENPVVVREIQINAIAYDDAGQELETQTIWVGNTISPKIIRGMTVEDIPHLQDLQPLKSFEVPPGDSIPFTVVFLKSAKNAKAFSCEVIEAKAAL